MSEAAYVEMPVIQWMCGEQPTPYRTGGAGGPGSGLGGTYRNEAANPGSIIGRSSVVYPNTNWRGILPANMIVKNHAAQEVIVRRPR